MKIRVEFLLEQDKGITRAYIWRGMTLLGKHPFAGQLTSAEEDKHRKILIKKFTEGESK